MFLTELSPAWLRRPLGTAIELLAAIPSIVYGMWGLLVFSPIFATYIEAPLGATLGRVPVIGALFQGPPIGIGLLCAGIILAIMIIPFIASVMRDVFEVTPPMLKESVYGLGGTTWEVVWKVVLPYTRAGVVGGIMLGLGRALGETMAVTFVIGNTNVLNDVSLFSSGNSITSALANEFAEASPGLHTSALIELGLVLFVITFFVLAASKLLLVRLQAHEGTQGMNAPSSASKQNAVFARRRLVNKVALSLSLAAMAFGLFWLIWILVTTVSLGVGGLSLQTFTAMTPPPNAETGGLANAIVGSILMVTLATLVGTPIGVLAGIYLAEYGGRSWLASATRFINDILLSAPSIVIGLFVYAIYVARTKSFSGFAGVIALALLVIPVVVRTTENMLKLIPNSLREAAFALGTPRWKVIVAITLKSARAGVVTGVLLAVARIAGETAPLLFTALSNQFWSLDPTQPMANLPVTIFKFAMSPFANWQSLAWAGVLIITVGVLGLNIFARTFFSQKNA